MSVFCILKNRHNLNFIIKRNKNSSVKEVIQKFDIQKMPLYKNERERSKYSYFA
jgi:hypothetical protein